MSQPSILDVLTPFDVTGYTGLTAAELQQYVSGVTPYADKGMTFVTVDVNGIPQVPNANTTPKWQNYMWIRQLVTSVTCYVWNPNGATDATFLNWVTVTSVSIAPGSITGAMIAPNTITAANIASVNSSAIVGSVPNSWLAQLNNVQTGYATNGLMNNTSLVFGDLAGAGSTVALPVIGVGVVTGQNGLNASQVGVSGKLALGTVTGANLAPGAVLPSNIASNGGTATVPESNGGVDPRLNIMVPTKSYKGIPSNSNPLSAGQNVLAGDMLAVDYNATTSETGFVTVNRAVLNLADPASITTLQVPVVAPNGTTYTYSSLQGTSAGAPVGRILQKVIIKSTAQVTSSGNIGSINTTQNYNASGVTAFFNSGAFTPLSSASTIILRAMLYLTNNTAASITYAGIYSATGATVPSVFGGFKINATNTLIPVFLEGSYTQGSVTPVTFYVAFGASGSSTSLSNQNTDGTTLFGGLVSTLTIEEYV